jgi:glycosyltransferase involved in cell wall biosynthesis
LDPQIDVEIVKALLQFTRATAISADIRRLCVDAGIPERRISDIPNGVDLGRLRRRPTLPEIVRRRYGLPLDKRLLLTVGRNHPKKGYDLIPELIARVSRSMPGFHWVLVGRGCESIVDRTSQRGMGDFLTWIPEVAGDLDGSNGGWRVPAQALIDLFKAADVFVFPTRMEGLALVLVEAMAAGLPVVTTSAPGCVDLVDHEVNGLMSAVDDVDGLTRNILRLLDDSELAKRLSIASERRAERFGWVRIAEEYSRVYESAIQETR